MLESGQRKKKLIMIYCVCICSNKFSKIKIFYVWAENLKIVLSFNVKFVSMNFTDVPMVLNKVYTFKTYYQRTYSHMLFPCVCAIS